MKEFIKKPTVLTAFAAQVVAIITLFLPWVTAEGIGANFIQLMQSNADSSGGMVMLGLVLLGILGTVVCFIACHPKISLIPTALTLGIAAMLTFAGGANGIGIYLFMGMQGISLICGLATGKNKAPIQEETE